jgi:uncharacterized protein involved in exopolysaccharide biosynthesis/Mrp family chromosome partitioning ATPase
LASDLPLRPVLETSDTIDVAEIASLLRRKLFLIVIISALAGIFSLFRVMNAVPQFTAHGSMYLGDAQGAGNAGGGSGLGFLSDFTTVNDVETQLEIITATALIEKAVLETGLNAQIVPADAKKIKYWRWKFTYHGRIDAFAPDATSMQALYASTPGNFKVVIGENGAYRLLAAEGWFKKPNVILTGTIGKPAAGHGVSLLIQGATPDFQAIPGKVYDLSVISPERLAEAVIGGPLSVVAGGSVVTPTKVAYIQFGWNDPYKAQEFVNQVMQDFIASQLSWKTESASTTEQFVSDQLDKISASLATADQNLAAYQAQTGILSVPQNAQAVINALSQYETQRTSLQLQQEALQQLAQELNNTSDPLNPYLVSQTSDTVLAGLTSSLSDAEIKLSALQLQFTGDTREIQIQQAQISKLQYSIRTIVNNDLSAANKNLASLDKIIGGYNDQIKTMPAESLKVISLQRASDVFGQLYVLLMEKEEEAEVSKAATIINTRIITPADTPQSNTTPKAAVSVVFGAFAGFVIGVAFVFGQRATSGRFESASEIRNAVQLPVYGAIPRQVKPGAVYDRYGLTKGGAFFEAFRLLRSRLTRVLPTGSSVILLVIAPVADEGTAIVAVNLAKTLADNGKRVLLVDADFDLGPLNNVFKIESGRGLIDWLVSKTRPQFINVPSENFKILPAGTASLANAELLDDPGLAGIFAQLREEFDYIILDSPPLPLVSDGLSLGSFADLILSVVSVSHTPRRVFLEHSELLATLDRPYGVIMNAVRT